MNELNYASLEASKKLYEAGIVLETEYFWAWDNDKRYVSCVPRLMNKGGADSHNNVVPAPCFTDVWRELPEEYDTETRHLELQVDKIKRVDEVIVTSANYIYNDTENGCCVYKFFAKENPTDALIDLLVWLKGAGK